MKTSSPAAGVEFLRLINPRAIDGDAIDALVEIGFDVHLRLRFRLRGFFAPELGGALHNQGEAAAKMLQAWLDSHNCSILRRPIKRDKYGRWVGTLVSDGKPTNPVDVLGELQMGEIQHKLQLENSRRP